MWRYCILLCTVTEFHNPYELLYGAFQDHSVLTTKGEILALS